LDLSRRGLGIPGIRIDEHGDARDRRHQLAQDLQPLRRQFDRKKIDARHVTAGPGETSDKTEPDRVLTDQKDDRYGSGRGSGSECSWRATRRYDNGGPTADQISRQRG
jgi:hypothetical protein